MRPLGHLLLWVGFLSAAFWSVFQLELSENRWMTVPWLWYAVSMVIGVVGIVLLRTTERRLSGDAKQTENEFLVIQESLEKLLQHTGELCNNKIQHPSEVLRYIDDECVEPLAQFADSRQALVKRYGLQTYADVMTEFASGERYLNRAWSAAADGYIDEVSASLDRAHQHLQKAQKLVKEAA